MKAIALDIDGCHLGIADLDALRIGSCVELTTHSQAGFGGGGGNQFDYGLSWSPKTGQGVKRESPAWNGGYAGDERWSVNARSIALNSKRR